MVARGRTTTNSSPPSRPEKIVGPQDALRRLREDADDLVAGGVAIGVIDPLEVVEVEHDEGERRALLAAALEQTLAAVEQGATVSDAGQRILAAGEHDLHLAPLLDQDRHEDGGAHRIDQAFEADQAEPARQHRQARRR